MSGIAGHSLLSNCRMPGNRHQFRQNSVSFLHSPFSIYNKNAGRPACIFLFIMIFFSCPASVMPGLGYIRPRQAFRSCLGYVLPQLCPAPPGIPIMPAL